MTMPLGMWFSRGAILGMRVLVMRIMNVSMDVLEGGAS